MFDKKAEKMEGKRNFLSFHCLVGLKTVKKENKYDIILF